VYRKKIPIEGWMLLPTIVILAFLSVYPFIYLIRMSFMEFSLTPGQPSRFVGAKNWLEMIKDSGVLHSWIVTLKYYGVSLGLQMLLGTAIALLIYNIKALQGLFASIISAPLFLAPVLVGLLWRFLLDPSYGIYFYWMREIGIFRFLEKLGFSEVKSIFGSPSLALPTVIAINTWEWTPLIVLIILAGLVTLPQELIEAASIDGASFWQRTRFVVIPLLKSTFVVALLIRTMDLVRFFTVIFITTGGGPADLTKILAIRIYENAFRFYKLGYASTIGITLLGVTIFLSTIFVRVISRK